MYTDSMIAQTEKRPHVELDVLIITFYDCKGKEA